jgi:hypothetical protein
MQDAPETCKIMLCWMCWCEHVRFLDCALFAKHAAVPGPRAGAIREWNLDAIYASAPLLPRLKVHAAGNETQLSLVRT